ncbi:MAG TPA: response regulator [Terriglobales bacterium]|nr:response regulator [Terriglobales bacterium]
MKRVLLADEGALARRMGTAYLEDLGCEVEAVSDGEAALAAIERRAPELILAAAKLPGIGGVELCRRVKAHSEWRAIPFLILTGALDAAPPTGGEAGDPDGGLRKPLSSAGLEPWLRRIEGKTPQELLVLAVHEAARGPNSE